MAAKFDKDMLLKHRFWVLVAVTGIMTLTGIFYLQLYGGEEASKARAGFKKSLKEGQDTKGAVTQPELDELQKVAEDAKKAQNVVWAKSYKDQEPLFTWSPKIEADFQFLGGKFAQDIKIYKADDKAWPEDLDTADIVKGAKQAEGKNQPLLYAKFIELQPNWIKVKTRKGADLTIFRMENITITDADASKPVIWLELRNHVGKWLAISYQTGKYFNDTLVQAEQDLFAETYNQQIHDILAIVDPVKEDGSGVVQFKNWLYDKEKLPDEKDRFIRFVTTKWDVTKKFSKEAWIAQEDIWIQREIYSIVKRTNDDISIFKPVGKLPEKAGEKCLFKNANFAIELILFPNSDLSFKITNLLQRRQKLDLNFRVKMAQDRPAPVIRISAEPLAPGASVVKTIPKGDKEFARTRIFSVEQVLTWETAAVKRIDHVTIGSLDGSDIAHTHKNFPEGLRPFEEKDLPKEEKKEGPAQGMTGSGAGGGKAPPVAGAGGMGGGLGGGNNAGGNKTLLAHGMWTNRYLTVTEQSRRIPVAISLIVDQDHVDRVLTHFNNSKLRFLESQVLLNHYTGSIAPNIGDSPKDKGGAAPFGPMKGFGPPPGMGGLPGAGGGADGPAASGGQDLETNMEVVIYGIMTLYQRFPPRPGAEKKQ